MSRWVSWHIIGKSVFAAITFASTLYTLSLIGPYIESRLYPVVGKLDILAVMAVGNKSHIRVGFEKMRDCEYIGLSWFDKRTMERVPVVLMREPGDNSSPNRPIGYQFAGPWAVSMPADQVRANSIVDLYHRCWPFWMTRTRIYP